MITRLSIRRFKCFREYDVDLGRLNLLVGGNNSGKTTVFHALQTIFWCIERTADITDAAVTFRKTQVATLGAVPSFQAADLFFGKQQQAGRRPTRIQLAIETDATPRLTFEVYRAFGRNLLIDGAGQTVRRDQFDRLLNMKPVYIPGTIGITVEEEYLRAISQERLIAEGRQNQVLRNLLFRLSQTGQWNEFVALVQPLFALQGMSVPFDVDRDEWLTATYREGPCVFDILSAGSGFLQTINLLCFLFLHESKTALLDEPDSHMHDDLQRVVFSVLDSLSQRRNLQIIVATHSATMIDVAGLDSVLLIDRTAPSPRRAVDVDALVPLLNDQGLSLPPNKVLETLRTRRALFVEGFEDDYETFIAELGEISLPGFAMRTRGLKVFATGGSERKWPFAAIECFERLLGNPLEYVFVSDRDFWTDEEIQQREDRAVAEGRHLSHLRRRHRESYLLDPRVLVRLLAPRWEKAHPGEAIPALCTEVGIREFVLRKARESEDQLRADLTAQHEPELRGDQDHRARGMVRLNEYFRHSFSEPVNRGEVPYGVLDSKDALRTLRAQITADYRISFSDTDICRAFRADEIPDDLRAVLAAVQSLFPALAPRGQEQQLLDLQPADENGGEEPDQQQEEAEVQPGG